MPLRSATGPGPETESSDERGFCMLAAGSCVRFALLSTRAAPLLWRAAYKGTTPGTEQHTLRRRSGACFRKVAFDGPQETLNVDILPYACCIGVCVFAAVPQPCHSRLSSSLGLIIFFIQQWRFHEALILCACWNYLFRSQPRRVFYVTHVCGCVVCVCNLDVLGLLASRNSVHP